MSLIPSEHIVATFSNATPKGQIFLDALPTVPTKYSGLATDIPEWADTLGFKRWCFAALIKVGLGSVRLSEPESGVYVLTFWAPGFKWEFAMIPEIAYAMSVIVYRMLQARGMVDMSVVWRGQTLYIPHELARRFLQVGVVAMTVYAERCKLFHDAVFAAIEPTPTAEQPTPAPVVEPDNKLRPPSETEMQLLQAGAAAYKQYRSFRTAFYISVAGNIIMFYYVMQTTGAIVK